MFSNLSDRVLKTFDGLLSRGVLAESDVNTAMREIRVALLEADVPLNIAKDFVVDLKQGDILFTKDGKIGSTGMIVKEDEDKAILSAGVSRIRLKKNSKITPEYLFLALTVKEIGFYQADRKTVVASTLPHLKESEILNFVIPQLDENTSKKISKLIKNSFEKKNECKILIKDIRKLMDNYYPI